MSRFHQKPIAHVKDVQIKVSDLRRSLTYYVDLLGFRVLNKSERQAVLTADGTEALITLVQPNDVTAERGRYTGLYHFAILLPSRADLAVFLRRLIETKTPFGASDHYVSEALYLNDPDGNGIEVYRDRADIDWEWQDDTVNMATVPLDVADVLMESDESWQGMPPGTILGHMHLHVSHLQAAEDFYTKGLGMDVVAYYPQAVFLSYGGYHHHLGINTWQGAGTPPPPAQHVGLLSYSIVFPDEAARAQVLHQLEEIGSPAYAIGSAYIVRDPSHNQVRLLV